MANLKDYIVRKQIGNTDQNQKMGNSIFDTQDYVFLESYDEAKSVVKKEAVFLASDYAVLNSAFIYENPNKNKLFVVSLTRSAHNENSIEICSGDWMGLSIFINDYRYGLRPALRLNASAVILSKNNYDTFKIKPVKNKKGNILCHTLEFGSYPQDRVKGMLARKLENLFNINALTSTSKVYTGYIKKDGSFEQNPEFEYRGKKYVRVITKRGWNNFKFKDGEDVFEDGTPAWTEVQPINWIIENWDELPIELNPNGTGKSKTIYVKSKEVLVAGIPFYTENYERTENTMWQNSPTRAYLNGYDIYEELNNGNGNVDYKTDKNFNFKNNNFLNEAFDIKVNMEVSSLQNEKKSISMEQPKKPLSIAEQIRNEIIKKSLKKKKQAQQVNNNDDQNENVM